MMQLFDTHFHFYAEYGHPGDYWENIRIPELAHVLACGADYEESLCARSFADNIPQAYFAAGVHPHSADKFRDGIKAFHEFRNADKLVAVGEIGLDYFYEHSDRGVQRRVMEQCLELALEWRLPAIVHCRDREDKNDSYADALPMLRDFSASGGRFEVHCYTGTIAWAEKILELGAYIGITGIITFPKAQNVRDLLPYIPDERLLLETDSPYLAPVPHRGTTNNPGYIIEVARKVAELKNITVERCAELTTANAIDFFRINPARE